MVVCRCQFVWTKRWEMERSTIGCLQRLIKVIKVFVFEIVQRPPYVCSVDHNFKSVCLNTVLQHINESMKYWTISQLPPVRLSRPSQVYCQTILSSHSHEKLYQPLAFFPLWSFCLMEHRRLIKQKNYLFAAIGKSHQSISAWDCSTIVQQCYVEQKRHANVFQPVFSGWVPT